MKNPLVSVIVPTKNSQKTIDACLDSVKKQSYRNIETIVVDNNSSDKTKEIAKKYTNLVFNRGPERCAQKNYGAKKCMGDYLVFIDGDMVLTRDIVQECVEEIEKNQRLKAVIIPGKSFGQGFWAKCRELELEYYLGIGWIEAARFIKNDAFKMIGGFNEDIVAFEEFDLPQKIKRKYPDAIGRIKGFIYHNEQNINLGTICKKKFYYAQNIKGYLSHPANVPYFKKQTSPKERYKLFFSDFRRLFKNPAFGLGLLFMKFCEFVSGGLGFVWGKLKR